MTKKNQRTLFTLLIVGGLGYLTWKNWPAIQAAVSSLLDKLKGGGGETVPAGNGTDNVTLLLEFLGELDPEFFNELRDRMTESEKPDLTWLRDFINSLFPKDDKTNGNGGNGNGNGGNGSNGGAVDPRDAANAAGMSNAVATALKAFFPIWLGTTKEAAEMTHNLNVALTHAIGQETGLERGMRTLMTSRGPVIVDSNNPGTCYNLAGKRVDCPKEADVVGVEVHTRDYIAKLLEEAE